ncbi:MAG: serine hydrolase domain-containing protein [Syntrophobacteraceae bacterium]|jgi:CubicO group peptidase (beta-lactamase class C family)
MRLLSIAGKSRLDAEFKAAICRGAFSGASLLVSQGRAPIFERTWGSVESDGAALTPSTRFDLASLTKPLVTAPLCMAAIQRGLLGIDDPISRFFPGSVPGDKEGITVRSLLSHSSGFPAYEPFYLELVKLPPEARRNALASMILQTALDTPPGKTSNYSDPGFMLLGLILERQMGARLDSLARDFLFDRLGIDELHFCPTPAVPRSGPLRGQALSPPSPDQDHFGGRLSVPGYAATQLCPWRKRLLFGEVDDENAWTLNGVAGHAGLFGTARGVFKLLCFLWNIYEGDAADASPPACGPVPHPAAAADGGAVPKISRLREARRSHRPLWPRDLVRLFWTRTEVAEGLSDWCLGYDTPSRKGYSSAGRHFSRNTIGHLGFTGVSFWLDLEKRVLVILLTNRVHPTRQNDEIRRLRPVFHDIIMEALGYGN